MISTGEILLNEIASNPLGWFYCSFADDDGFRGAVVVEAHGLATACQRCYELGCNPGGQLFAVPINPGNEPPVEFRNRLLSKDDVLSIWPDAKTLAEHEKDGYQL